jgi:hypothetical protein
MKKKTFKIRTIEVKTEGLFPQFTNHTYTSKKEFLKYAKSQPFFRFKYIHLAYSIGSKHLMEYELKPDKNVWIVYLNSIELGSFSAERTLLIEEFEHKFLCQL